MKKNMKTKGFIYLISIIFVLLSTSCEEEHIMTKMGDSAGFAEDFYFKSVKTDDNYIDVRVLHNSINVTGSKAEIEVVAADGTNASFVTLDKTVLNFDDSDTVTVRLTFDYASLVEDVNYSVTLKFTNKYLGYLYGGHEETVIDFSKWRPRRMDDFVGTYTVDAVSNYNPGAWDEEWTVTTAAHATDATKLLITGIAGSTVAVEAIMDFDALTITIPYGQDIGDVYGYGVTLLYNSNASLDILTTDLTGTLYENNNFVIDYMVMWEDDQGWDWDIFTPMFTKD
ncbi:hypothetical protein ACFLSE_09395 [Bacteroidota bacterium]